MTKGLTRASSKGSCAGCGPTRLEAAGDDILLVGEALEGVAVELEIAQGLGEDGDRAHQQEHTARHVEVLADAEEMSSLSSSLMCIRCAARMEVT